MINIMFNIRRNSITPIEKAAIARDQAIAAEVRSQAMVNWLINTPISETSAIFATMAEEVTSFVRDVTTLGSGALRYQNLMIDHIGAIRRYWMQIDKQKLTNAQVQTMYTYLDETLPKTIKQYIDIAHKENISYAYELPDKGEPSVKQVLADVIIELHNIKASQNRLGLPLQETITRSGETHSFPKFHTVNLEINQKLEHFEELWKLAYSKSNSVEEEYFLEEITTNYLPEAWKMFSLFRLAKKEYSVQAEKLFAEQITLLHSKVQSILDSSFAASLLAMSAQNEFLKAKLEDEPILTQPTRTIGF
jgi:hypothetical protein